jgi:hypothetical protein
MMKCDRRRALFEAIGDANRSRGSIIIGPRDSRNLLDWQSAQFVVVALERIPVRYRVHSAI